MVIEIFAMIFIFEFLALITLLVSLSMKFLKIDGRTGVCLVEFGLLFVVLFMFYCIDFLGKIVRVSFFFILFLSFTNCALCELCLFLC